MMSRDLDSWALRVMQEELAARQGDPHVAGRDTHGHPLPGYAAVLSGVATGGGR